MSWRSHLVCQEQQQMCALVSCTGAAEANELQRRCRSLFSKIRCQVICCRSWMWDQPGPVTQQRANSLTMATEGHGKVQQMSQYCCASVPLPHLLCWHLWWEEQRPKESNQAPKLGNENRDFLLHARFMLCLSEVPTWCLLQPNRLHLNLVSLPLHPGSIRPTSACFLPCVTFFLHRLVLASSFFVLNLPSLTS